MGQQQLLLLVFGVIIVGVAVIAGIQAVADGYRRSESDNMIGRNLEIANSAIAWKVRWAPYRGTDISYADLLANGMEGLAMDPATTYANFALTSATTNTLVITSVSIKNPDLGVRTYLRGQAIDSTVVRFDGSIMID